MSPGLRLRQVRERLGLTYRDVERASYELAARRGRSEFVIHLSRLADIENHGVIPTLHKLYTLAVVYHLNPNEVCRWYEVPLDDAFIEGAAFPSPETHLAAAPSSLRIPIRFDPAFDPRRTEFLTRMVEQWGQFEGLLTERNHNYRYGYIGLGDKRMAPLLRPGSIVLVDASVSHVEDAEWTTEYDRPMYFVQVRAGYRCGWFHQEAARLVMQPHPLSRCVPESWRTPEEAEVVGRVVGVVTRLNEPWNGAPAESAAGHGDLDRKVP